MESSAEKIKAQLQELQKDHRSFNDNPRWCFFCEQENDCDAYRLCRQLLVAVEALEAAATDYHSDVYGALNRIANLGEGKADDRS